MTDKRDQDQFWGFVETVAAGDGHTTVSALCEAAPAAHGRVLERLVAFDDPERYKQWLDDEYTADFVDADDSSLTAAMLFHLLAELDHGEPCEVIPCDANGEDPDWRALRLPTRCRRFLHFSVPGRPHVLFLCVGADDSRDAAVYVRNAACGE